MGPKAVLGASIPNNCSLFSPLKCMPLLPTVMATDPPLLSHTCAWYVIVVADSCHHWSLAFLGVVQHGADARRDRYSKVARPAPATIKLSFKQHDTVSFAPRHSHSWHICLANNHLALHTLVRSVCLSLSFQGVSRATGAPYEILPGRNRRICMFSIDDCCTWSFPSHDFCL